MQIRWPDLPPFKCTWIDFGSDDMDCDYKHVNQETIDDIIEFFQAAKESMN